MATTNKGGHKTRPNTGNHKGLPRPGRPRKRMTRSSVGGVKLLTGKPTLNRNNPSVMAGHWMEAKTINGHQYWYECWREGGKKRSKYFGKAKPA